MNIATRPELPPPRTDSRQMVLDQAARLFRDRGYAETSLRDIATACDMRTASLYHHFASKEEIVLAVLNAGVATVSDEARNSVDALGPEAPPADRVRTAIHAHLRALLEMDDYTGANIRIFGHVPPHVRQAGMPQRERYEQWWRDLLDDAAARGAIRPGTDLRLLRLLLLGAMNWSVEWHEPRRGADSVAAIARSLTDMALHGAFQHDPPQPAPPQHRPGHRRTTARKG